MDFQELLSQADYNKSEVQYKVTQIFIYYSYFSALNVWYRHYIYSVAVHKLNCDQDCIRLQVCYFTIYGIILIVYNLFMYFMHNEKYKFNFISTICVIYGI